MDRALPRSNRYILPGRCCHITHRCHNKSFLLKFARDRDAYLDLMRESLSALDVSLLNYDITCNHVHLLINPQDPEQVSDLIQHVAGKSAQAYNRRKCRSGAFWEGRFHVTMIEDGMHLWNCLKYVDLNMVRAGVVHHPQEWRWTGYRELVGLKQRYRLLDIPRLMRLLGGCDLQDFRMNYIAAIRDSISKDEMKRDPRWTESIAVGGKTFVEGVERETKGRRSMEVCKVDDVGASWVLKEAPISSISPSKSSSNPTTQGSFRY